MNEKSVKLLQSWLAWAEDENKAETAAQHDLHMLILDDLESETRTLLNQVPQSVEV